MERDMVRRRAVCEAAQVLPRGLRTAVLSQDPQRQACWEELRLRAGRGLFAVDSAGREAPLTAGGRPCPVTAEDLRQTVEIATRASMQGAAEQLAAGFLPLPGGHRLGLCGSAALREGRVLAVRTISSLNLRIACPVTGAGAEVLPALMERGRFQSSLILAPPGEGKTTLLRDLIRLLGEAGIRTGLADERGEVAALRGGVPQLDVGPLSDIADGCPKGEGLMLLLRAMSPQVLAADEITCPADTEALCQGANCGAALLATAHAAGRDELERRAVYQPLLAGRVFRRLVTIRREGGARRYLVERLP